MSHDREGVATHQGTQHKIVIDCDFQSSDPSCNEPQSNSSVRQDQANDDAEYRSVCIAVKHHFSTGQPIVGHQPFGTLHREQTYGSSGLAG